MLKIKHVVITKIKDTYFTSCFEENFRPIKNIATTLKLVDYCQKLNTCITQEEYYLQCEQLFQCSSGKCLLENLTLVSIDHNEYNAWIIFDTSSKTYVILQFNEMRNIIETFSIKDWLDLHYPITNFVNDVSGYSQDRIFDILSEIDHINKSSKTMRCIQNFENEKLQELLEVAGIQARFSN